LTESYAVTAVPSKILKWRMW